MLATALGDWAQLAGAAFTAVTAGTALLTVVRAERERRAAKRPELHIEVLQDLGAGQVRATVVNYGGPAREVVFGGTLGEAGFFGPIGPSTYWRSGETRVVLLGMRPDPTEDESRVIVAGWDMAKSHLVAATTGGARESWPLRKAKRTNMAGTFRHFFPTGPGLGDSPRLLRYDTIERDGQPFGPIAAGLQPVLD